MISEKQARRFCCDDISLIRGYERAVNDTTQKYELHHLEGVFYTKDEMIRLGKYYKQPAMALIFLTKSEHAKIHTVFGEEKYKKISEALKGRVSPMTGKHHSEESKMKISESHKGKKRSDEVCKRISESKKGRFNTAKSKKINQYTKDLVFVAQYPSIAEVQRQFGFSHSNVSSCLAGRIKSAYGYIWRYAE